MSVTLLERLQSGDLETIEAFQRKRKGLIQVLESLETDIRVAVEKAPLESAQYAQARITALFEEKNAYIRQLLALDDQVLQHIERLKSETIQKIQSLQAGKKGISAYRSPLAQIDQAESAGTLDQEP